MNKLSPILDIILLTLFIAWAIWSWDRVNGIHACVIERSVVSQVGGAPVTVRVEIVGQGRW